MEQDKAKHPKTQRNPVVLFRFTFSQDDSGKVAKAFPSSAFVNPSAII
jgi:hypothetical protein